MILLSSFRLEFLGQTTSDILALPFEVTAYFESKAAQQTEPRDDSVSPLIVRYHHKDFVNDQSVHTLNLVLIQCLQLLNMFP